jgi:hypothetical protein
LSDVDQLPSGAETAVELAELLVQARHRGARAADSRDLQQRNPGHNLQLP